MLNQPLFWVGILLLVGAILLAYLQRARTNVLVFAFLGAICCLVGIPHLQKAIFKGAGLEATFDMGDQEDIGAIVGPINAEMHALKEAVANQITYNKDAEARIAKLEAAANIHPATPLQPNIEQVPTKVAANGNYLVILFYRDGRERDAEIIKKLLIDTGFAFSSFNSSLKETTVHPQTPGSVFIAYTETGKAVDDQIVSALRNKLGPGAEINKGGAYAMRRGDIQIYLF